MTDEKTNKKLINNALNFLGLRCKEDKKITFLMNFIMNLDGFIKSAM